MRHIRRTLMTAPLLAMMAAPCAANPKAAPGLPLGALPGDGALTCTQILAEGQLRNRELDALMEARDQIDVNPSAGTVALQGLNSTLGMLFGALTGPLAAFAGQAGFKASMDAYGRDMDRAYADIDARFDFALERMDMMHGLYQAKCLGAAAAPAQEDDRSCDQLAAAIQANEAAIDANQEAAGKIAQAHVQAEVARMQAESLARQVARGVAGALPGVGLAASAAVDVATAAAMPSRDPVKGAINALAPVTDRQAGAMAEKDSLRSLYVERCMTGGAAPGGA